MYSTGHITMDFFFGKKWKILNISKTKLDIEKMLSVVVRETKEKKNAKTTAFHFKSCGTRKIPQKHRFLRIKSFLCTFREKVLGEKSVSLEVLHLLSNLGNIAS